MNPMQTTYLKITGMNCPSCAAHTEKALQSVPGVARASVDLEKGSAAVEHDGLDETALVAAVDAAGYEAEAIK